MTGKIIVEGFKSIGARVEVEVRPLTLLAGANSSGKSSLMQALLLLKQTLECNYDPGPLLLNGPNVRFTSVDQILHTELGTDRVNGFTVGYMRDLFRFETRLERSSKKADIDVVRYGEQTTAAPYHEFHPGDDVSDFCDLLERQGWNNFDIELRRERFWLSLFVKHDIQEGLKLRQVLNSVNFVDFQFLHELIHIPGLRGNPERAYPITAVGPMFRGTFEKYAASLIHHWMNTDGEKVAVLGKHLKMLGLTSKVESKKIDGASIELQVGRLAQVSANDPNDMVNIADVGFGVSQTLPVLVALLAAKPGQLVYIEQPEIHLHPKAQVAMASPIAEAAKRGVLLVIETHSSLLLLAIQTLVAQGELNPDLVKLHWFEREEKTGATKITSRDLDQAGRFGDWPEDFDDVSLEAQSKYLDSVDALAAKE